MKTKQFSFSWPLVGNQKVVDFLSKSIENDKIANTYIFSGPDNLGKTTVAKYFAQSILCDNLKRGKGSLPCLECATCSKFRLYFSQNDTEFEESLSSDDFYLVNKEKDKKNISIEQIRSLIKSLSLSSFAGKYKVAIIKHAESLSEPASNALLKTLEEAGDKVVLILITTQTNLLPKTILSRAQILNFYPVSSDIIYDFLLKEYNVSRSVAKNYSRLCLGRPALAVKFIENKDFFEKYYNNLQLFISILKQNNFNDRLEQVQEIIDGKKTGQATRQELRRVFELWQGLFRDLYLLEFNQSDLVQNEIIIEDLKILKKKVSISQTIHLINLLSQAKSDLEMNISPKMVLENVIINF